MSTLGIGAHLASIHSAEENRFVYEYFQEVRSSVNELWIGYKRFSDTSFAWIDGSAKEYDNWNTGEPNSVNECCETMFGFYLVLGCIGVCPYFASRAAARGEVQIPNYSFYLMTIICGAALIVYH